MLNEEFKFEHMTNKGVAANKNYSQAVVFLKDVNSAKRMVEKIKNRENMNSNDKRNLLLALHVIRMKAKKKPRGEGGEETREAARKMLFNVGIDMNAMDEEDTRILKLAEKQFNKDYEYYNKKEKKPEETPDEKQKPEEQKPEIKQEPSKEKNEPETTQEPYDDEGESEIRNRKAPDDTFDPKDTENRIKKIKQETLATIDKTLANIRSEKDIGAKSRAKSVERIKSSFAKKADAYIDRSLAGPQNARLSYNKAITAANTATSQAETASLKGAVGRTIQGAGEVVKNIKNKAEITKNKIKNSLDKNESLARAKQTIGKVKERIKPVVQKGLERAEKSLEKEQQETNYAIINKYLGEKKANIYKNNPEKNANILKKAKDIRNEKAKTMTKKVASTIKNAPQNAAKNVTNKIIRNMQRGSIRRV